MTVYKAQDQLPESGRALAESGEELRNRIWPRSVPLWMVAFYVSLFIVRPWEQLFPSMAEIHFERIYALFMIAVVLLSGKRQPLRMTFQSISVLLFLAGVGVSGLLATNPSLVWDPFYKYLTLVVFYFILLSVIRTPYELVFMVVCYIVTMTVYLAKSQWEFFVNGHHYYTMGIVRLIGIENTFGGPNDLAMSVVASLPMLLFLWSVRKEFSGGWPTFWRKWLSRVLSAYFLLAVSSIILTNSRSGMVGLVLFIALVTIRGSGLLRKMGQVLMAVILLFFLWQFMPDESRGRFETIWNPGAGPENAQVSAQGRIEGYKAGVEMFSRFPLTGVGIGNFIDYRVNHLDGIALQPHNLVGQVLGETGLLGAVTFAMMVLVTYWNCRKVKILTKGRSETNLYVLSGLALACISSLLLFTFEGIFSHNLLRFNWLFLASFSVLLVQFTRQILQEKWSEEHNA